jgi:hypothetical protein
MPYQINQEIRERAKKIGVIVQSSKNKDKKLDAYDKQGNFITSFGASGYKDYHLYKSSDGSKVANEKRKLYKARHEGDRHIKYRNGKMTAGYLADKLLW